MEFSFYLKFFLMGALLAVGILNLITANKIKTGAPLTGRYARIANAARNRSQKHYWLIAISVSILLLVFFSLGGGLLVFFTAWAHWRVMKSIQAAPEVIAPPGTL